MAASKIWLLTRAVILVLFILVVANIFWIFKLQKQTLKSGLQLPHLADPTLVPKSQSPIRENVSIEKNLQPAQKSLPLFPKEMVIAAVVCGGGDRVNETLVMMKSALILSTSIFFKFILFADEISTAAIQTKIKVWPDYILNRMHLDLHPIMLPKSDKVDEWKKLFKPCASQRLFLPSLLENVDSLLYMDTDTVFLTSPHKVWQHFYLMNDTQMAAVAPEHEDVATGWYNRFARHPYYGNLGVNSGVMLMNLTRMRTFGWERYVIPIYQEYKSKITWGDQDIVNIFFHFHPEKLYVYPCHFNFRPDHCMYMSVCKAAEETGVYVAHGNRGSFHNEKQPSFRAIYDAIDQYQFGDNLHTNLLIPMEEALEATATTNCGKVRNMLIKALESYVSS